MDREMEDWYVERLNELKERDRKAIIRLFRWIAVGAAWSGGIFLLGGSLQAAIAIFAFVVLVAIASGN